MSSTNNNNNNTSRKDHWTSEAYNSAAGFVPKLTSKVVSYLDPKPNENILDIGCGDGSLTAQIANSSARVLGVDASRSFIETAKEKFSSGNCEYLLHDATKLETCPEVVDGQWDKVFSNAAMHWILRPKDIRKTFFENMHKSLKPGGKFVFEMGGAGNVAEIQASSISALVHIGGLSLQAAREASPWFFPSVNWMEGMLRDTGFEVEKCELEYRPSQLSEGALEGWIRLMCADMLECVEEGRREGVVREMGGVLETILTREEDGSQWMGYVRLRGVGRKI